MRAQRSTHESTWPLLDVFCVSALLRLFTVQDPADSPLDPERQTGAAARQCLAWLTTFCQFAGMCILDLQVCMCTLKEREPLVKNALNMDKVLSLIHPYVNDITQIQNVLEAQAKQKLASVQVATNRSSFFLKHALTMVLSRQF